MGFVRRNTGQNKRDAGQNREVEFEIKPGRRWLRRCHFHHHAVHGSAARADAIRQTKGGFEDKFRQLEGEDWPTPNDYRNASGAPGHRYWQQKVDYDVRVRLDEARRSLTGSETIRYRNNSPDALPYLWLLLDQNNYKRDSISELTRTVSGDKISLGEIRRVKRMQEWEGGFTITAVRDAAGQAMPFSVTDSLMRIELPQAVAANGGETSFTVEWFLTGFIADEASRQVYGRPVSVQTRSDGALIVVDDAGDTIWLVRRA